MEDPAINQQNRLPDSLDAIPEGSSLGLEIAEALEIENIGKDGSEYVPPYITYRRLGLATASQDSSGCTYAYLVGDTTERLSFKFYPILDRIGITIAQCSKYPRGKIMYHPAASNASHFKFWLANGEKHSENPVVPAADLIVRKLPGEIEDDGGVTEQTTGIKQDYEPFWSDSDNEEVKDFPHDRSPSLPESNDRARTRLSQSPELGSKRKLRSSISTNSHPAKLRKNGGRASRPGSAQGDRIGSRQVRSSARKSAISGSQMHSANRSETSNDAARFTAPRTSLGSSRRSPSTNAALVSSTPADSAAESQAAKVVVHFKPDRDSNTPSRVKLWSACDTVNKLFKHALAGGLMSSSTEEAVLEVNIYGHDGEKETLIVAKGDEEDFAELHNMVEEVSKKAPGGLVRLEVCKL